MRLFFYILVCVLVSSSSVLAQINPLFPELSGRTQQVPAPAPAAASTPAVATQQAPASAPTAAPLFPELKTNQQLQQEAEEATQPMSGNLRLVIDDVNATLPPARNFSYCMAKMILENETPRRLESLEVTLTFGDTPIRLGFQGVDKKGRQEQSLALAGDICQSLLSTPKMEVNVCKMAGVPENSCSKRVEFVPIP